MPKRSDLNTILVIGAGPIVIGQACEFDYSGAQACKALREEGYRVVLVNSNPATIMTDPATADAVYIEPVDWQVVERIIERERPDAILPTMGGQTGLNCALDLFHNGVLDKYSVELIGARPEAIDLAEDRDKFRHAMTDIGLSTPNARMLEESVLGWKEYEMEVVRDSADNCIIVCSIENLDPMGVHTGDSITVAPAQTLTDKELQIMRNASIDVLRKIGVDTGGSNVQFAVNPDDGRLIVIEMNPRVSRSSALASKATGFPIARVAAKLAVGVMAIGRNQQESLQKALRGLEIGVCGFDEILPRDLSQEERESELQLQLSQPGDRRLWYVADAFRLGYVRRRAEAPPDRRCRPRRNASVKTSGVFGSAHRCSVRSR